MGDRLSVGLPVPNTQRSVSRRWSGMAAYKFPRSVVLVDDLPKTVTGKVLRRELRE